MLQFKNTTPFAAEMFLFPNADAIDTLYTVVNASFKMSDEFQLAEQQKEPCIADIYWGDEPAASSLKYPSDAHIGKPATDIAMMGKACAIDQQPVQQLDVNLQVGSINKTVKVYGDRYWQNGQITQAEPFTSMALVYEKAFGGQHLGDDDIRSIEARNPVGCGYAGDRIAHDMNGNKLPNVECPNQLIKYHTDTPVPSCFGFIAPFWSQRSAYAGTYDANWESTKAPYLPDDFDARFLNMVSPDLIFPGFLKGGEQVTINNMHPSGPISFTLPRIKLNCKVDVAGELQTAEFNIETLLLEPNLLQYSLTLRAALPCGRHISRINDITVSLSK